MSDERINCIAKDGFPYLNPHAARAMVGRHQRLSLPREEYERLRAQGRVILPEEMEGHDSAAKLTAEQVETTKTEGQRQFDELKKRRAEQAKAREAALIKDDVDRAEKRAAFVKAQAADRKKALGIAV